MLGFDLLPLFPIAHPVYYRYSTPVIYTYPRSDINTTIPGTATAYAGSIYKIWTNGTENTKISDDNVPSVVGGDPVTRHGIVLTKSIPAKKFNIQTGESIFGASAKCPELIIVRPNYGLYMQCSKALGDILREYSPLIEQYSIDEYFLDFSNMERLYKDPVEAAYTIKDRIKNELGFTVNVGISTNKILAKMASELKKPDKVHTTTMVRKRAK